MFTRLAAAAFATVALSTPVFAQAAGNGVSTPAEESTLVAPRIAPTASTAAWARAARARPTPTRQITIPCGGEPTIPPNRKRTKPPAIMGIDRDAS